MNAATHLSHTHDASLETSLDFINTLEFSRVASTDELPTPERAAAWLADRGLIHEDRALASLERPGALERVHAIRAALRALTEASMEHRPPPASAIAELNRALRGRSYLQVAAAADGVALGHHHLGDPLADALAVLVEPVVQEITVGRRERLRVCASDTCRWAFFDESRTGRRRWCDMSTCGNRAKAARHRARAREPGPEPQPGPEPEPGVAS